MKVNRDCLGEDQLIGNWNLADSLYAQALQAL